LKAWCEAVDLVNVERKTIEALAVMLERENELDGWTATRFLTEQKEAREYYERRVREELDKLVRRTDGQISSKAARQEEINRYGAQYFEKRGIPGPLTR
jgi:hypothetical protein